MLRAILSTPRLSPESLRVEVAALAVAKALGFAASFALPLLLIRSLDPTQFGLYKQAFLVIATTITLLPFGFPGSLFYFFATERGHHRTLVNHVLGYLSIVAVAVLTCFAMFPRVLKWVFADAGLLHEAPLIGAVAAIWLISGLFEVITSARRELAHVVAVITLSQVSKSIFLTCAALIAPALHTLLYALKARSSTLEGEIRPPAGRISADPMEAPRLSSATTAPA